MGLVLGSELVWGWELVLGSEFVLGLGSELVLGVGGFESIGVLERVRIIPPACSQVLGWEVRECACSNSASRVAMRAASSVARSIVEGLAKAARAVQVGVVVVVGARR